MKLWELGKVWMEELEMNGIEDVERVFQWAGKNQSAWERMPGNGTVGVGSRWTSGGERRCMDNFLADKKPLVLKQGTTLTTVIVQNEDGSTENRVLPAGTELIPQEDR